MKYLIAILMTLSLTACQTAGTVLQGFGNGLTQGAQNQKKTQYCTATNTSGQTTYLNCH